MTALPNLARDVHKVKFHQVHCISIATNGFFVRDALSSSCSMWPDLVKIRHFCKTLTVWSFVEGLFCIWQTIEPTLAIICYWANFHRCNFPQSGIQILLLYFSWDKSNTLIIRKDVVRASLLGNDLTRYLIETMTAFDPFEIVFCNSELTYPCLTSPCASNTTYPPSVICAPSGIN